MSIIVLVDGYVLLEVNNKMLLVKITNNRESQRIAKGFSVPNRGNFLTLGKDKEGKGM